MNDWTSLSYAVVDVEGNGQQPPDLVELAVVPIVGRKIGEPQSWLVRPQRSIKYFATRVHGLSNEDVADQPPFADVADEVRASLDVSALVAHNAHVDTSVLTRELVGWQCPEVFDTLKLAKRLLPNSRATSSACWSEHSTWPRACPMTSRRIGQRTTCW
jgi:exodeoxyribonuclease X